MVMIARDFFLSFFPFFLPVPHMFLSGGLDWVICMSSNDSNAAYAARALQCVHR